MATLILSYPGAAFRPEPAEVDAAAPPPASRDLVHAAMGQWLQLCDHITRAGGRILLIDPLSPRELGRDAAGGTRGASSPVYAGRLGAAFLTPGTLNTPIFLRAVGSGATAGPSAEAAAKEAAPSAAPRAAADPIDRAITQAGLQVRHSSSRFGGQLDVLSIDRNRYILTYGQGPSSSSRASLEEVKALLPLGAQTLLVELRPPYVSGSQGIAYLTAPSGAKVLLVHRGALLSHTPEDLIRFAGNQVEYFVLSPEDAAAGACECLAIRGTLILSPGSSTILRGQLARRGFQLIETEVGTLCGPRHAGPRRLACELPGLVLSDDAPSYALRRDELLERRASYKPAK